MENRQNVLEDIQIVSEEIDGIKIYECFGINATSGKCDRESMAESLDDYFLVKDDEVVSIYLQ